MTLEKINRIAVLKLRNIGDTLLATPALRNLRNFFPKSHISVFVGEGSESILENNPSINEIVIIKRSLKSLTLGKKVKNGLYPYQKMFFGSYDLVLDYTTGDRASFLTLLSKAKYRAAFKTFTSEKSFWKSKIYTHFTPPPPFPTHEVIRHLSLLNTLTIPTESLPLELYLSAESIQWAKAQFDSNPTKIKIHFHPVSRWLFKCWDDAYAAELIQRLSDQLKATVIITSSNEPREMDRVKNILSLAKCPVIDLSGRTTLSQTAAISKLSDLFIGVDTGPMHMATAVGTPVVALFGPSGVETWRPWAAQAKTIYHECHCNLLKQQTCLHDSVRDCLKSITVDEVYQSVIELLDQSQSGPPRQ